MTRLVCASALLLVACDKPSYRYADDVVVQYSEGEKVASIKAQLGCEGAHPAKESDGDKTEREKLIPKSDLGKAWIVEACRIADAFDAAGPVTTWPTDKAVWAGQRICRSQINRVAEKIDETSFARMGRVEIQKGQGEKLWVQAPEIDKKDKVLGYNFLITDVSFRVTEDKLPAIDAFWTALASGGPADVETLRKDETASDRQTSDASDKIVATKTVRGFLVSSEGSGIL